jgi:hypothetical protein
VTKHEHPLKAWVICKSRCTQFVRAYKCREVLYSDLQHNDEEIAVVSLALHTEEIEKLKAERDEARAKAFEEAIKYVRWKMEGKGNYIHPAAKSAFEESILTIQTADMPRSSVMEKEANNG